MKIRENFVLSVEELSLFSSFKVNRMFLRLTKNFFWQASLDHLRSKFAVTARFISSYQTEIVNTEYGPIKGDVRLSTLGRKYFNFQGVPYAKAPLGQLRFRDAQPPGKSQKF